MRIPSLEFPVQWPDRVRFGGTLPPKAVDPSFEYPDWFARLRDHGRNGSKIKKIVLTTQGTLATQYTARIVPTIQGLADRDDVVVVATLGVKGGTLDGYFPDGLPENAIVEDYFPYSPLLDQADVVVTNGSYGIFSQCAVQGAPMVLAGSVSEDEPEVQIFCFIRLFPAPPPPPKFLFFLFFSGCQVSFWKSVMLTPDTLPGLSPPGIRRIWNKYQCFAAQSFADLNGSG